MPGLPQPGHPHHPRHHKPPRQSRPPLPRLRDPLPLRPHRPPHPTPRRRRMKYIPPIQRKEGTAFGRTYHYYIDGDNKRIPGVTTIIGDGIPKPKLINWAGRATAEGAIDQWDELTELPPAKRLKKLEGIRYEDRDKAADKGTQIHLYGEALVQGIEVRGIPDELRGHVDNYVQFIDAWKLDPVLVEAVVVNYTRGYAGTLDLIADLDSPPANANAYCWTSKPAPPASSAKPRCNSPPTATPNTTSTPTATNNP